MKNLLIPLILLSFDSYAYESNDVNENFALCAIGVAMQQKDQTFVKTMVDRAPNSRVANQYASAHLSVLQKNLNCSVCVQSFLNDTTTACGKIKSYIFK
jgi:hypothetical protein